MPSDVYNLIFLNDVRLSVFLLPQALYRAAPGPVRNGEPPGKNFVVPIITYFYSIDDPLMFLATKKGEHFIFNVG